MKSNLSDIEVEPDWFYDLTGFEEKDLLLRADYDKVFENLSFNPYRHTITSRVTGREMYYGILETPTLVELVDRCDGILPRGDFRIDTIMGDAQGLHKDRSNAGATFQVASQFNLLEMTDSYVKPSGGIKCYQDDNTQGPACAIACGAGTLYRNYYAQTDAAQIDCLRLVGEKLYDISDGVDMWEMRNGYCFLTPRGAEMLDDDTEEEVYSHFNKLQVGVQTGTEVTLNNAGHRVTQVFCSAVPLAYYEFDMVQKALPFANKVLESAYQATLAAGIVNAEATKNHDVFLTLLGGGAFGNKMEDILLAIKTAVTRFKEYKLNVHIVCHNSYEYNEASKFINRFFLR